MKFNTSKFPHLFLPFCLVLSSIASSSDEVKWANSIISEAINGGYAEVLSLFEEAYSSGGAVSYILQDGAIDILITRSAVALKVLSEMEDSRVRYIFEYWFGLPLVSVDDEEVIFGLQEVVGEYESSFPSVVKLLKETMASSGVRYISK